MPPPPANLRAVTGYLAGVVVGSACLTLVFLGMRTVMGVGGACADGGPYVSAQPCPEGSVVAIVGGTFGLLAAGGLMAWFGARLGAGYVALIGLGWPALFISLGGSMPYSRKLFDDRTGWIQGFRFVQPAMDQGYSLDFGNPDGEPAVLRVSWIGGACELTATLVLSHTAVGLRLLVTERPVCLEQSGRFRVVDLLLDREIPADSVDAHLVVP